MVQISTTDTASCPQTRLQGITKGAKGKECPSDFLKDPSHLICETGQKILEMRRLQLGKWCKIYKNRMLKITKDQTDKKGEEEWLKSVVQSQTNQK